MVSGIIIPYFWILWYFLQFYARINGGRVAEWLKAHDSKSCDGVDPFGGSNPLSSAIFFTKKQQKAGCRISLKLDANPPTRHFF